VQRRLDRFRLSAVPQTSADGLFASVLASAAMLYGAVANISRRDFKHIGLPLTRQP
jgi:hypothetical protein